MGPFPTLGEFLILLGCFPFVKQKETFISHQRKGDYAYDPWKHSEGGGRPASLLHNHSSTAAELVFHFNCSLPRPGVCLQRVPWLATVGDIASMTTASQFLLFSLNHYTLVTSFHKLFFYDHMIIFNNIFFKIFPVSPHLAFLLQGSLYQS